MENADRYGGQFDSDFKPDGHLPPLGGCASHKADPSKNGDFRPLVIPQPLRARSRFAWVTQDEGWSSVERTKLPFVSMATNVYHGDRGSGVYWWARLRNTFSFLVDQDCLLPAARLLVFPVNAASPAARPLLPLQQFVAGSCYAALARCCLFCVFNPANELIPAKRREVFP